MLWVPQMLKLQVKNILLGGGAQIKRVSNLLTPLYNELVHNQRGATLGPKALHSYTDWAASGSVNITTNLCLMSIIIPALLSRPL